MRLIRGKARKLREDLGQEIAALPRSLAMTGRQVVWCLTSEVCIWMTEREPAMKSDIPGWREGGRGSPPYTAVFPNPLMPVDGMPILEVIVRSCPLRDKGPHIHDEPAVGACSLLISEWNQVRSRYLLLKEASPSGPPVRSRAFRIAEHFW